jgi:hypothetical protein
MTLLDRNRLILDRVHRLSPIAEPVRTLLLAGKREQLSQGVDATGSPFAPLAPSTLAHRADGPPLAPPGSRIVSGYTVDVRVESGRLTAEAGWPGLSWIGYHIHGTRWMPRRDPGGFREQDKAKCMVILKDHVLANR